MSPHLPVLLTECVAAFSSLPLAIFVDCTLGAGGHAEAILREHPEIQLFLGIDQDQQALQIAQERLKSWSSKTHFIQGNFSHLQTYLKRNSISAVDGILMDLGVSSMQFDRAERGFSLMKEGPLDMRMDSSSSLTAEEIVNTWSEADLGRIFLEFGEEKNGRKAARAIVQARSKAKIETTVELVQILRPILEPFSRKRGIHPLTLIFQALRICVNRELEVLEQTLPKAIEALSARGRLAVISFHSLEDRIVKNQFRFYASDKVQTSGLSGLFLDKEPIVNLVTKKPIVPSLEEIKGNPRSSSAKLRVVEKR